jgi:hypothetical protein
VISMKTCVVATACLLFITVNAVLDVDELVPEGQQDFYAAAVREFSKPAAPQVVAVQRSGNTSHLLGPDPIEEEATEKHINTTSYTNTTESDEAESEEELFPGDAALKASIPPEVRKKAASCTATCEANGCESEEDADKDGCQECAKCQTELKATFNTNSVDEEESESLGGGTNPHTKINGELEHPEHDEENTDENPPFTSEDAELKDGHYSLGHGRRRVGAGFAPIPSPVPANVTEQDVEPLEPAEDEEGDSYDPRQYLSGAGSAFGQDHTQDLTELELFAHVPKN